MFKYLKLFFLYSVKIINLFFLKTFSKIIFLFLKIDKKRKLKNDDLKKKNTDVLINHDLGLGDNTIILESLQELDTLYKIKNKKLIVINQNKYKPFFESFSFSNINFFYVDHRIWKLKNSLKGIIQLINIYKKNKKILCNINVDNVFFTRSALYIDDLIFLSSFKYKKAYKFYNSCLPINNDQNDWLTQINGDFFSYLIKFFSFNKFNINVLTTNSWWEKDRKKLINELVFFVNGITYSNQVNQKKIVNSKNKVKKEIKICVNPFSTIYHKNINLDFLLEILNSLSKLLKIKIDFYGSSEKEIYLLKQKINYYNFKNKIYFNLNLLEYFNIIKNYDFVISNDSATFHIGNYWKKKTLCFFNVSTFTYTNNFNYWSNKNSKNNLFVVLSKDYFEDENNIKEQYKSLKDGTFSKNKFTTKINSAKLINYISRTVCNFIKNEKDKSNILINRGTIF